MKHLWKIGTILRDVMLFKWIFLLYFHLLSKLQSLVCGAHPVIITHLMDLFSLVQDPFQKNNEVITNREQVYKTCGPHAAI